MSTDDISSIDGQHMDEDSLQDLYTWIDEIPLTRPKRNITRDFSDGVMIAESIHYFCPKLVDLHNYTPANSSSQKMDNWNTLNRKVFPKLSYHISDNVIKGVIGCKAGVVEFVLQSLRDKIDKYVAKKKAQSLREQQQVYDEFSPDCPITDYPQYPHDTTAGYDGGMYYGGPEGYNTYPYNAGPPDSGRYQPQYPGHPTMPQPLQGVNLPPSGPLSVGHPPSMGHHMSLTENTQASPKASPGKTKADHQPRTHLPEKKKTNKSDKIGRTQSYQDISDNTQTLRLALEEKEQSLLASQETVQILQVKIRRLEHLLHLKDIRIDDLTRRLQQQPPPRQLPPQHYPLQHPPLQDIPPMHHPNPLPPLQHHTSSPSHHEDGIKI